MVKYNVQAWSTIHCPAFIYVPSLDRKTIFFAEICLFQKRAPLTFCQLYDSCFFAYQPSFYHTTLKLARYLTLICMYAFSH